MSGARGKEAAGENCEGHREYLGDAQGGTARGAEAADCPSGSCDRAPVVAADLIGAGVGETVIVVSGSSARSAVGDMSIPVDATVVGIVDDLELAGDGGGR